MALAWLVVLPVVWGEPSPQSIAYAQGASFTPGSLKVALSVTGLPNVTVWFGPAFTVGATLPIVAVVVAGALAAPRASGPGSGTGYVPLSACTCGGRVAGPLPPPAKGPGDGDGGPSGGHAP